MQSNSEIFLEERENTPFDYSDYDQWQQEQLGKIDNAESLAVLKPFEQGLTKSEIKVMASTAVDSLLEQGNVLQVAEAVSAMECFIKELKADKRYTDYVREEVSKTPKGYVSNSGAKIELAEIGSAYDFSKCNDPLMEKYLQELEDANEQVKAHQQFLKTVPISGIEVLRGDEVIRIFPPAKSSNSSYKISLAK
jgi:hypothetical protein